MATLSVSSARKRRSDRRAIAAVAVLFLLAK
jgi:hypothetical protein